MHQHLNFGNEYSIILILIHGGDSIDPRILKGMKSQLTILLPSF